ncbi:CP [Arachis pintoi virus]|uniref:CP n=1 Tax=Arachis pintoi virus TaxID=1921009 RepID=A0A3G1GJ43_9VIRU|nr:CP [Arachis pintoi virus]APG31854.1 CP [Arachis pintoi virus]
MASNAPRPEDSARPISGAVPNTPPNNQSRPETSAPTRDPLLPSREEMQLVTRDVQANKIASRQQVEAILQQLRGGNVNDLMSLVWACFHNGSSRLTTLRGQSPSGLELSYIKDVVEEHCTLRQFCTFYAKVCYNTAKELKTPPANWASKGFKEDTQYAAFDFFSGTMSPAAITPEGGMKYKPTPDEIKAHSANALMAIIDSRDQADQYSTRGNMLAMRQERAPPPPLITFQ